MMKNEDDCEGFEVIGNAEGGCEGVKETDSFSELSGEI